MTTHEEALKALGKEPKKEKPKKYKSQDGFVRVPVYRGFTEIGKLHFLISNVDERAMILGGYVRYMCSPAKRVVPATDVDVYSPDMEVFEKLKKQFKIDGFEVKAENDLALTYKPFEKGHPFFGCPQVQLIKPMEEGVVVTQGEMEKILENFDFTVVRIGLIDHQEALADADFLHDEEKHQLRIKNIHCPISSAYRVMKYRVKGYWPPTFEILKLFLDWDERDEDYIMQIFNFFQKEDPTQEEVDELEKMLRLFD
jgi:hypothetical protein